MVLQQLLEDALWQPQNSVVRFIQPHKLFTSDASGCVCGRDIVSIDHTSLQNTVLASEEQNVFIRFCARPHFCHYGDLVVVARLKGTLRCSAWDGIPLCLTKSTIKKVEFLIIFTYHNKGSRIFCES